MIITWLKLAAIIIIALFTGMFYTLYLLRQTIGADAFTITFAEMGEQSMKNVTWLVAGLKKLDEPLEEEEQEDGS